MNKKPVMFRLVVAAIIIAVFAFSIYPLKPLDFYSTLKEYASPRVDSKLTKSEQEKKKKEMNERFSKFIVMAKEIEKKDKVYPSIAVERAARKLNVNLTKYVVVKGATGNKDVIGFIKMKAASSIRLGIDLNGGVEFLLELVPAKVAIGTDGKPVQVNFDRQRDAAIEVLRNRLESENIFEAEISPVGDKFVSLKVPTVSKEENESLLKLLKMSARLEFRKVHPESNRLVAEYLKAPKSFKCPTGYALLESPPTGKEEDTKARRLCVIRKISAMRGRNNISDAFTTVDSFGQRMIILDFTRKGAAKFGELTTQMVGKRLAIVLDGTLYSAPVINEPILTGRAQITGSFSREEANRISKALMSGNLPKINVVAMFETDPTLGADAVHAGMWAGIYGIIAVVVFMALYYMLAGLIADIALVVNVVLIVGFLATFQATLTLPGIAGIILTIGMAVDANVLIFERIREELKKGKNVLTAIDLGYSRAFVTIFDANITTLFVALILIGVGSGPIKGFAVTLAIGIVTSMFSALFLTRVVFDFLTKHFNIAKLPMLSVISDAKFNFLGMKKVAFTISGALILMAIVVAGIRGTDALGIDFTGGSRITYSYDPSGTRPLEADIVKTLEKNDFMAKVSYKTSLLGGANDERLEIIIRGDSGTLKNKVKEILTSAYPDFKIGSGNETSVGGLIGQRFIKSAIWAILLAFLGIIVYVSFRFEFSYGVAAIIALLHDVSIATGLFLLSGYVIPGSGYLSLPVVAALLTIIGYSLNDTIVVFDRIREDAGLVQGKSYKEIINLSVNQTLSRTILTSFTTMMVLVALYLSGTTAINDFVLVMIIGIVVGTYSSIFIASPIVAVWHKRIGANIKEQ
jgi:SecD/SecF fusion protein